MNEELINPFYYKVLAFCLGAFGAAFAGGLWAHLITAINPKFFTYNMTFSIVSMIIIGGSGSISGCMIGAALITIFPEMLRTVEKGTIIFGHVLPPLYGISQIILSLIIILILVYKPGGIMGYKEIILPDPIKIGNVILRKK